jgi:hypothetical protein
MTETEKMQIAIIVRMLRSPRDRLGRLQVGPTDSELLRQLGLSIGVPNGGLDHADQAQMILCGMIGEPMQSIWSPASAS